MRPFFPVVCFFLCSFALAQPHVQITTTSLQHGTVGLAYSATIRTSGGVLPFAWSAEGLPTGLKLGPSADTRTATLSGTPSAPLTHKFSISVEGHGRHVSTAEYTLTIEKEKDQPTVDLRWEPGAENIAGYNVYRGTASGGPYSQLNNSLVQATDYTDTNVVPGKTYYYVTNEVNEQGERSGFSNEVEATVPTS
jgi:hypothetical protein